MQEITCLTCSSYLGWKIVRAHEESERWKEGNCLLELENLHVQIDTIAPLNVPSNPSRPDSDSGSDSGF